MKIIVTDLTRFSNKDIVCLAGINPETGQCVRPMIKIQNRHNYLSFAEVKSQKIVPGSILDGQFTLIPALSPPHIEDHSIVSGSLQAQGPASGAEFRSVLDSSAVTSVRMGFGSNPTGKVYSVNAPPPKSIITLRLTFPATQFKIVIASGFGEPKFKAHVIDDLGLNLSWLPVTDLGFSDHLLEIQKKDPTLSRLNNFLSSQDEIYLRIGLSRAHAAPDGRTGYWVQVNGIYSFPDYLQNLRIYD